MLLAIIGAKIVIKKLLSQTSFLSPRGTMQTACCVLCKTNTYSKFYRASSRNDCEAKGSDRFRSQLISGTVETCAAIPVTVLTHGSNTRTCDWHAYMHVYRAAWTKWMGTYWPLETKQITFTKLISSKHSPINFECNIYNGNLVTANRKSSWLNSHKVQI